MRQFQLLLLFILETFYFSVPPTQAPAPRSLYSDMDDNDKLAAILITSTCRWWGREEAIWRGRGPIALSPAHCSLAWPAGTFIVRIFLLLVTAFQWLTETKNKKKTTTATSSDCLFYSVERGGEKRGASSSSPTGSHMPRGQQVLCSR